MSGYESLGPWDALGPEHSFEKKVNALEQRLEGNELTTLTLGRQFAENTAEYSAPGTTLTVAGPSVSVFVQPLQHVHIYIEVETFGGIQTSPNWTSPLIGLYEATDWSTSYAIMKYPGQNSVWNKIATIPTEAAANNEYWAAWPGAEIVLDATPGLRTYSLSYAYHVIGTVSGRPVKFRNRRIWATVI